MNFVNFVTERSIIHVNLLCIISLRLDFIYSGNQRSTMRSFGRRTRQLKKYDKMRLHISVIRTLNKRT